jgi:NAD-dependent dihydropyrimidine dehydrogenase PreA subunit
VSYVHYAWINVLQTLLRVLPFPCRTGLVKIGTPGRDSPVLLTCNFRLTVERVRRAIQGIDAYLLVANSRGINVWCAATGGLFTNHDVIAVLKTSGIEDLVDHRQLILPQLAATGIEGAVVHRKTGWTVVWGPVRASAIPAFLKAGSQAAGSMRTIDFPWPQRLEMAVAWASPISLLALLLLLFWPQGALPVVGLVWALSALIFLSFPLYHERLRATGGRITLALLLWLLFMAALLAATIYAGSLSWPLAIRWGAISLIVVVTLTVDLMGSTPVYKGGFQEDRLLHIALDGELCTGAGLCEQVCPRDVFHVDYERRAAIVAKAEACVQCGACIVQCPCDALHFRSATGAIVPPETVRRFKVNLLGRRLVDSARAT